MCFLGLFKKKPPVSPEITEPTSSKVITSSEIARVIAPKYPEAKLYLSDTKKLACAYDDIALFLAQDATNRLEYKEELYDCDDFAFRLKGQFSIPKWSALAVGLVWTNAHALLCFITEDKRLFFLEPQNDDIQSKLKVWQGSRVRFIIM